MQLTDILDAIAKRPVRLRNHLPGAAKLVEVVHIGRAQIGLQGIEQLGQRDPLRLGFDAIHVGIELRHVGLITRNWVRHARCLGYCALHGLHGFL
ncbi:hypothetical protein D3C80_1410120 [compost metagenome]